MKKYIYIMSALAACMAVACNEEEVNVPGPKIYFASDGVYEIGPKDTIVLSPKITYDRKSTYEWTQDGEKVATTLEYKFVPKAMKEYSLKFGVSNANGEDEYDVRVSVLDNVDFGTFDNYEVPKKTVLSMVPGDDAGAFKRGDIKMLNIVNSDTTMWEGFAFSNRTSQTSSVSMSAIGCAYVGTSTSSQYMVASCYGGHAVIDFGRAYSIKSIDIANDNFAYLVSKFGYENEDVKVSYSTTGDKVTLKIEGLSESGGVVSEVDYDLVDCTFDNPAKYFRLSSWKTIGLSDLGQVYGLRFEIDATQENFPKFFCVDNIKLQD